MWKHIQNASKAPLVFDDVVTTTIQNGLFFLHFPGLTARILQVALKESAFAKMHDVFV